MKELTELENKIYKKALEQISYIKEVLKESIQKNGTICDLITITFHSIGGYADIKYSISKRKFIEISYFKGVGDGVLTGENQGYFKETKLCKFDINLPYSYVSYTLEELIHLRDVRALGFDDDLADERFCTDRSIFKSHSTNDFFEWLLKMERKNKIEELLKTMKSD